jgi:hypothetical protein
MSAGPVIQYPHPRPYRYTYVVHVEVDPGDWEAYADIDADIRGALTDVGGMILLEEGQSITRWEVDD